jgi:hypothetical protein
MQRTHKDWTGPVSQRRLTIYWKANERLGRSRASGATRSKTPSAVGACQSGADCHVSSPTLFGARNVRASSPLFNNCGNKIGGQRCCEAPAMRLLHQHETQTGLGAVAQLPAINAVSQNAVGSAGRQLMGRSCVRDFKFQSCAAGVARSSTAQAGCVMAHLNTEPAKAIERRPCTQALLSTRRRKLGRA